MFNEIFIGDIFGLIIALPIAMFLAFWLSAVKSKAAVVIGAFIGGVIGFVVIWAWAGTLVHPQPLPGANGVTTFFSSAIFSTITGLIVAMLTDLIVGRISQRDYRHTAHEA